MESSTPNGRGIFLDTRLWPVVLHRAQPIIDVPDMERYNQDLAALLARNEPFASIVLVKGGSRMGMAHSKLDRKSIPVHGAWLKANAAELRRLWLGIAFVLPGDMYRLVLSALLLAAPAATEYKVFATAPEAGKWLAELFRKAGVTAPMIAAELAKE